MQDVPARVCSPLEHPLVAQHEPRPPQGIPKGWAVKVSVTATAPTASLGWKAELKASRQIDLKVYGEGLLFLLLKA